MVWGWFGDGLGMVLGWFWDGVGVVLGWFWSEKSDFSREIGRFGGRDPNNQMVVDVPSSG